MRTIAASLAAVLLVGLAACGDDGAEPGAPPPRGEPSLELILDFQPNAVHSGIFVALERGLFAAEGVEVEVREPGASTDAPKLLRSGRADLAILDIHDLALAREAGIELVGVGALVSGPLAAVIAADRERIRRPADLAGAKVGVTGLPSDEAVLESVLSAGGLSIGDVETVTIGFEAVPALLSGRLDAATAFWNAEGVELAERLETREFRAEDFGAPPYPELVLATTPERLAERRPEISAALTAIGQGYEQTIADPDAALDDLLAAVPELDRSRQSAQLAALGGVLTPTVGLDRPALERWADWEVERGIVERRPDLDASFDFEVASAG